LLDSGKDREAEELISKFETDTLFDGVPLKPRLQLLQMVAELRLGEDVLEALEAVAANNLPSPYLRARLAEAMGKTTERRAEALKILDELEKQDLMPDAEAWADLARLRNASGDAAGRERAVARCLKVSRRPSICRPPGR
jgi:predicted Zn-dependent protease